MKLQDIFKDKSSIKIYSVENDESEFPDEWEIEPTNLEVIPDEEGHFIVIGKKVYEGRTEDCYINMVTPERIAEIIVKENNGDVIIGSIYGDEVEVIPGVASDCFGIYELYYSKENPDIGINILKEGLSKSKRKTSIVEDLGYIFRDENRLEESIQAFLESESTGPSSEYIFDELAQLYAEMGNTEKALEYKRKFESRN